VAGVAVFGLFPDAYCSWARSSIDGKSTLQGLCMLPISGKKSAFANEQKSGDFNAFHEEIAT
jgi:hypothetical protein